MGLATQGVALTISLDAGEAAGFVIVNRWGKQEIRPHVHPAQDIWAQVADLDNGHVKTVPPDGEDDMALAVRMVTASLAEPDVVETSRTQERIGRETRTVDNRGNPAPVTRTITVTRMWSGSAELEKSSTSSVGLDLTMSAFAELTAAIKETLVTTYRVSEHQEETVSEQVVVTVPGNTCIKVEFVWKQLVAHGVVRRGDTETPYRAVVGVTFDQKQTIVP